MAFVSGGKIIAIGKVKTDGSITGDGVVNPLHTAEYEFLSGKGISVDVEGSYETGFNVTVGLEDDPFTKEEADKLYASKDDIKYLETKQHASETYQVKGDYVTSAGFSVFDEALSEWAASVETSASGISAAVSETKDFISEHSAAWGCEYTAGDGIDITNKVISLDSESAQKIENSVTNEELAKILEAYYTRQETSGANELETEFAKYQLAGDYVTSAGLETWSANNFDELYDDVEELKSTVSDLGKEVDGKLDFSEFDSWSATTTKNISDDINYVSGYIDAHEKQWEAGVDLKPGEGISIKDKIISVSGYGVETNGVKTDGSFYLVLEDIK